MAIGGTGGYGSNALFASDTARAINVVMSGGAFGNAAGTAALIGSPGSSSSLTGVTVRALGRSLAQAGTLKIVRSTVVGRRALCLIGNAASARAEAVDSVFATTAAATTSRRATSPQSAPATPP